MCKYPFLPGFMMVLIQKIVLPWLMKIFAGKPCVSRLQPLFFRPWLLSDSFPFNRVLSWWFYGFQEASGWENHVWRPSWWFSFSVSTHFLISWWFRCGQASWKMRWEHRLLRNCFNCYFDKILWQDLGLQSKLRPQSKNCLWPRQNGGRLI